MNKERLLAIRKIESIEDPCLLAWFAIYKEAFPLSERRSKKAHLALMQDNAALETYAFYWGNTVVGVLVQWNLTSFYYIDYFATAKTYRNLGFGGKVMKQLLSTNRKPTVLEVEPPTNDLSRRRIKFYQRIGFHLLDFDYYMPNLKQAGIVKMRLMSSPEAFSQEQSEQAAKDIFANAYQREWCGTKQK